MAPTISTTSTWCSPTVSFRRFRRGCVGEVAHRLGLRPEVVLDVHNGGCAAFILLVELAGDLLRARGARKALIGLAQNSAGQIFVQNRCVERPRRPFPVTVRRSRCAHSLGSGSPVLDTVLPLCTASIRRHDRGLAPNASTGRPGPGQIHVGFTEAKIAKVLARGNRLVPGGRVRGRRPHRGADP